MKTQHDSSFNRSGLLLILGILLIAVVGYIVWEKDKTDMDVSHTGEENFSASSEGAGYLLATVDKDVNGVSSVTGTIVEMVKYPETNETAIKMSVVDVDELNKNVPKGESKNAAELRFKKFLFVFSDKNVPTISSVQAGDMVTVTFQGDPSEKDYVVAKELKTKK